MYIWQWGIIAGYEWVFIHGAMVTLGLTFIAIIAGTLSGLLIALARRSSIVLVPEIARLYIELFRAVPILVLLIWIFYVMPLLTGITLTPFVAGSIALTLHLAAYVAETIRGGIESINRTQYESGIMLGLTPVQVMTFIVLPQALRNVLPSLLGLYIETLKNSSITSVIAVGELLHRANGLISATYRPLEIYTVVAGMYLAIVIPATIAVGMFEKHIARRQRTL